MSQHLHVSLQKQAVHSQELMVQLTSPARMQATMLLPAQQAQALLLSWQPRMLGVCSLSPPARLQAGAGQAGARCHAHRSYPRTTSP